MDVASGCGEQEVGVASGSGWNLWVWLLGVVVRRYIDFLILLIPTPLVSVLFLPTFCSFKKNFFVLYYSTVQCSAVYYNTVQYSTVQCSIVITVQCSILQCNAVQCSAVTCGRGFVSKAGSYNNYSTKARVVSFMLVTFALS